MPGVQFRPASIMNKLSGRRAVAIAAVLVAIALPLHGGHCPGRRRARAGDGLSDRGLRRIPTACISWAALRRLPLPDRRPRTELVLRRDPSGAPLRRRRRNESGCSLCAQPSDRRQDHQRRVSWQPAAAGLPPGSVPAIAIAPSAAATLYAISDSPPTASTVPMTAQRAGASRQAAFRERATGA